ncbi:MAG: ABC-type transport auxiliary lipoprotein family protein [Alphaproteobacteria bacterium]
MTRTIVRLFALAFAVFWLSNCTFGLPAVRGPEPRLFKLSPASTFPGNLPTADWQLVVEPPYSSAAINTLRIALRTSPVEIDYYANASWVDRPPVMVQNLIIESFSKSGRIVGIGRNTAGVRANFLLVTDLRDFQAEIQPDGNHKVQVTIGARLVNLPGRVIVAATEIQHEAVAPGTDLARIVGAFDEAVGRSLTDLVSWTLTTGETIRKRVAAPNGDASLQAH